MLDDALPSLTIGYLMLDDSLGVPYHRLFNVIWFPFLKTKKFRDTLTCKYIILEDLPNLYFIFFDRYESHVQAFLYFINGQLIIFQSSYQQKYFQNMYSTFHKRKRNNRKKTEQIETNDNIWYLGHTVSRFFRFVWVSDWHK